MAQIIQFPDQEAHFEDDGCLVGMLEGVVADSDWVNPITMERAVGALADAELICCCGRGADEDTLETIVAVVLSSLRSA